MARHRLKPVRLWAIMLLPLLAGCETVEKYSLTYRLWESEDLRKFSEPAPDPKLALFELTNRADVLVQYDALSEKHSVVKRQSYYLWPNQARIRAGRKPNWAQLQPADQMRPIPVLPFPHCATNLPPAVNAYAATTHEGRSFDLYAGGSPESCDLPVYPETSGTPLRLVLTPFAVVGDTLMVGGVAAVVGFVLWAQSGAPTHY